MIQFLRRRISEHLIDEIVTMCLDGESAVVLAPRFGGKRHLLRAARKLLADVDLTPLIWFSVGSQTRCEIYSGGRRESSSEDPIAEADRLAREGGKPVVLIADGVDRLGEGSAREFLAQVRTRVSQNRLVTLLGGEKDLRTLVHGPNSAFNCAYQYVLQGYDRDVFEHYVEEYSHAMAIAWTDEKRAVDRLLAQTGGNGYLLRMQLSLVIDLRARQFGRIRAGESAAVPPDPIDPDDISWNRPIRADALPESYWVHVFQHGVETIAADPSCWEDLRQMVAGRPVQLMTPDAAPGSLEFSGFLRVDAQRHYCHASEIQRQFLEQHYTPRRFIDLHGRVGDWSRAFADHATLGDPQTAAMGGWDSGETLLLIRSLEAEMHAAASSGPAAVESHFVNGCRYLLGCRDVTVWKREADAWRPESASVDEQVVEAHRSILENHFRDACLDVHVGRHGATVCVPSLNSPARVYVASDTSSPFVISGERAAVIDRFFKQFHAAYGHAVQAKHNQDRLRAKERYSTIINRILLTLGAEEMIDIVGVLEFAAIELLAFDYSRALFSLVDLDQQRIRGALCKPSVPFDLAKATDYALDQFDVDLQPHVAHYGRSYVVLDAEACLLANRECVESASLAAFAVVPLMGNDDKAVGTVHVERKDGRPPSGEEIADLEEFGRQFAAVLAESDRVTLLSNALDKLREPILLVNRSGAVVFANAAGSKLLPDHIPSAGWRQRDPAPLPSTALDGRAGKALVEDRYVRKIEVPIGQDRYHGLLLCAALKDWRGVTVGGLIHVEDQNFLDTIHVSLAALVRAMSEEDLINYLLRMGEALRFNRVRYYRYDGERNALISHRATGFREQQHTQNFEAGSLVLARKEEDSWRCVNEKRPVFFRYDPSSTEPSHANRYGLEAEIVREEKFPEELEKEARAVWVDLPFQVPESDAGTARIFGKLTLERDPTTELRPEEFLLLKSLAEIVSYSFASLQVKQEQQRQAALIEGFDRAMGVMAHQFRNKLSPLGSVYAAYSLLADDLQKTTSGLAPINERFRSELRKIDDVIRRAPELLGPITLKAVRFDPLHDLFLPMKSARQDASIDVHCSVPSMEADLHHLEVAFEEVVENAVQAGGGGTPIKIEVVVTMDAETRHVVVEIQDNGPGIGADIRDRIFTLGFTARRDGSRGTGFGLYYVQRVIERHGGTIQVVDPRAPGVGSRFRVTIPQRS